MLNSLAPETIETLKQISNQTGDSFVNLLQKKLGKNNAQFLEYLSGVTGYQVLTDEELHSATPDFSLFSFNECTKYLFIPFTQNDKTSIAIADPFNPLVRDIIWSRDTRNVIFKLVHLSEIKEFLGSVEDKQLAMSTLQKQEISDNGVLQDDEAISLKSIAEDLSPIVKIVHATLYDALKVGVSDVHLETTSHGLTIKYRIDGLLSKIDHIDGIESANQIISRVKVMSELDIAEHRVPQDGRFKIYAFGRNIDLRVSIMPSIHGEDAVMRILDKQAITQNFDGLNLENLGFSGNLLIDFRQQCHKPYGMILVTGPTGSGKTTTLYAAISEINSGNEKFITIEDPVEYQLPGILQIPVNEKKGLTFAKGLRSILRHDPDKILVGEIRDFETAQIAIQSALTGHLVFTSVHANNVFDVINRFIHMGVDPYNFVSALNCILAQRLIRLNCPKCNSHSNPSAELLTQSKLDHNAIKDFNFMRGGGCENCRGTGYKGRTAISELLVLDDQIREMVVSKRPISEIKQYAGKHNTQFLRQSALDLVKQGVTTLEEINRVTFIA